MNQRPGDPQEFPRSLPGVSVVMPVLNEERHLAQAVRSILAQDYSGNWDVIVALGPSTDRTNEIARDLATADPRVTSVPNPTGRTPNGLNAAIAASKNPIVVRSDGHAVMPPNYIRTAVETLLRTGADNVGGVMAAVGESPFEQAVARAMTSKLGVGGAAFHVGGAEGPAESVYLGSFQRRALQRVNGYDETFLRAQDWEMNHRIRETGGLVWFTPDLVVSYRPRPTVARLARQYFEYGRWRRVVMRRHPDTVTRTGALRYLAAPIAVLGVLAGIAAGSLAIVLDNAPLRLCWLAPAGYVALVAGGSLMTGRGLPMKAWIQLPVAYATMHGCWGVGFLTSPRNLGAGRG